MRTLVMRCDRHSKTPRSLVAILTATALAIGSCGESTEDSETPASDDIAPRDGEAPATVVEQVDELRALPVVLDPSTAVGTLAGDAGVDARGQATYHIPIEAAPGVGPMTPGLALQYNSASGNGVAGIGFSLAGLSAIRRCARSLLRDGAWGPVRWNNDDALCLDGDRLVLDEGTYGAEQSSYRPAHDPSRRVVLHGNLDSPAPWFEVFSGDGLIAQYGTPAASLWRPDENGEPMTYVWSLLSQRDRFDNAIDYAYSHPLLLPSGPAQLQLDEVRYAGTGTAASKRKIRLQYDNRPDMIDGWFFGAHTRMVSRLASIDVEGPGGTALRRYELEYEPTPPDPRSYVVAARICDAAGVCLPDTVFDWQDAPSHAWDHHEFEATSDIYTGLLDPDTQEMIGASRQVLVSDLDGDLTQELIFRRDATGWEPWTAWNPQGAIGFGDGDEPGGSADPLPELTEFFTPTPPVSDGMLDDYVEIPPIGDEGELFAQLLPRYQPALGASIISFDGDRRSDILLPQSPAHTQGEVDLDGDGHPYAVGLHVGLGGDLSNGIGLLAIDDESDDRIYSAIALDHDGDRDSDVWLCRGEAYNEANWVLGLRTGPTDPGFSFIETSVGCSVHDELSVLPMGAGGQRLLVIPAYDAVSHAPIDDDERGDYRSLELDPVEGAGELVPIGLPRDRYQRWHDMRCRNGLAHAYAGLTIFSAGFGQDKPIDVNGDGLVDVLRFELAAGDGTTEQGDIEHGLIDANYDAGTQSWDDTMLCAAEADEHQEAGIRLYTNTGEGFAAGPFVHTFDGIAHANYWLNFVGAQQLDANDDGLADLVLPSTGEDGEWTLLTSRGDGTFGPSAIGLPEGWPAYVEDDEWREQIDEARRARVFTIQTSRRSAGALMFVGQIGDEPSETWPTAINVWRRQGDGDSTGRIASIVDGLGKSNTFAYYALDVSQMLPPNPQSMPVPGAMFVVTSTTESRSAWDPDAMTSQPSSMLTYHEYAGGAVDRLGGGLLGFAEKHDRAYGAGKSAVFTVTKFSQEFDTLLGDWLESGRPIERVTARIVDGPEGNHGWAIELDSADDRLDVERTTWDWSTIPSSLAGGTTSTTFARETRVRAYDLPCTDCTGSLLVWPFDDVSPYRDRTRTEQRDAFGTLTSTSTSTVLGEGLTIDYPDIVDDTDNWLLGRVETAETTSCSHSAECATRTTTSTYDSETGALTSTTIEPGDASLELRADLVRDPHGNVMNTMQTAAPGVRWSSTTYDAEGVLPEAFTNQLGQTSYVVHHASGAVLAEVDVAGTTTRRSFDGFLRPTGEAVYDSPMGMGDGALATIQYMQPDPLEPQSAMRIRVVDPMGQRTTTHLLPSGEPMMRVWWGMTPLTGGLPQQIGAGLEVFQRYAYDKFGNPVASSVPEWVGSGAPLTWTVREVDPAGNPIRTTAADGTALARFSYQHSPGARGSSQVTIADVDGHTRSDAYDGDGALIESIDGNGINTCFVTGAFGQLVEVRRNCGNESGPKPVTAMERDAFGRVLSEQDPSFGTRSTEWNAFGEMVLATDAAGDETHYEYDALGRVETITAEEGTTWFIWDEARAGALAWTQTPDDVFTSYEYDGWGRTRFEHTTVPSASGADDYVFENVWGPGPRLAEVRYPAVDGEPAFAAGLRWDQPGYLRGVFDPAGLAPWWIGRTANQASQLLSEDYLNGVTTVRGWNRQRGWMDSILTKKGTKKLQELTYAHQPDGEVRSRVDTTAAPRQTETFRYDSAHRLAGSTLSRNAVDADSTFGYDQLGNITSKSGVGAYSYDRDGTLLTADGASAFHDLNGNVIAHGTRTLTYTSFDKVATITSGGATQTIMYDAANARVLRADTTASTHTISIGDRYERVVGLDGTTKSITYRVPADGRIVAEFVRKPSGIAWITTPRRIHDDLLGSTNVVTDSVGALQDSVAHDAWGRARKHEDWTTRVDDSTAAKVGVGFTGHRAQLDGGLIDMRGRMYDPKLGRFLSADPVVADPSDGASWNRYSYVANRPLAFTDPSGFSPDPVADLQMQSCRDNGRTCSQDENGAITRYLTITGAERAPDSGAGTVGFRGMGRYTPWGFGEATSGAAVQQMTRRQLDFMRHAMPNVEFVVVRSKLEAEALLSARGPAAPRPPWKNPFGNLLAFADALDTAAQVGLFAASFHPLGNLVATGIELADGAVAAANGDYTGLAVAVGSALLPGPPAGGKGLRRPYTRKGTRAEVEARAPRDADGRPIDPNTGMSIDGRPDLGHKHGREFRREKASAEAEGLSQRDFNERMNDAELYQLEGASSNRSHKYEKKP
jgi:RHS repeat-associated protein